jgi:hypothetical protein
MISGLVKNPPHTSMNHKAVDVKTFVGAQAEEAKLVT